MLLKLTASFRGDVEPPRDPTILVNAEDIVTAKEVGGATVIDLRDSEYSVWVSESPNEIHKKVRAKPSLVETSD